ncbi:unnamed protein product [Absidia cylindrospora]
MSFRFNWPDFDPAFYAEAKTQLETALNKEKKSKHIADHIFVKELNMGSKPPELEILEICELSTDYFRGIFKFIYRGDSSIAVQTKIQANPLYNPSVSKSPYGRNFYPLPRHSRPDIVAAAQPLVIPMLLRISDVRLNGIIMLSVSKTKGITLVFKNDPLESLLVSSTFDIVSSVKTFLQQQIESQLRTFLQDTLPLIVHEFSLGLINNQHQQQQQHKLPGTQPTPFPAPSIPTSNSVPPSSVSISLLQQQHNDKNTDRYFNPPIINDESNYDTFSAVPDLVYSSSSSASECFSDTSSENFSLNDDDDYLYGLTNMATNHEKYINYNTTSMTAIPLRYLIHSTKRTNAPSIPTAINSSTYPSVKDTEHEQKYIPLYSPPLASMTKNDDNATDFEGQHYHPECTGTNEYHSPPLLCSSTTETSSTLFNQPIRLSSTEHPHGLLQRIQDLSIASQTIATALSMDNKSSTLGGGLVHKTCIHTMNPIEQLSTSMRRNKIQKRRFIRWNN